MVSYEEYCLHPETSYASTPTFLTPKTPGGDSATRVRSSAISWKPPAAATSPATASWPTRAPGPNSSPGRSPPTAIRASSPGHHPAGHQATPAALSFAFQHWDLKNPFAQNEPQTHYLMLADVRRPLAHLRSEENSGYGAGWPFTSPTPSSRAPAASTS